MSEADGSAPSSPMTTKTVPTGTTSPVAATDRATFPADGDVHRPTEVLVEAECQPGAVDPRARPLQDEVVVQVQRELCPRGSLDRRPEDLAVPLRRVPVAGGEARPVNRDRQEERRPGDELPAVDVPAPAPRRRRRMPAGFRRRPAEHARE